MYVGLYTVDVRLLPDYSVKLDSKVISGKSPYSGILSRGRRIQHIRKNVAWKALSA